MTQEFKVEEKVTGGIGMFFYALIPWAVGVGVLTWIGVATGVVEFHRHRSLADRMDSRVGVREPLKNPVRLVIRNGEGCVQVERAFADGETITLYLHSKCEQATEYFEWHWQSKAPDGTVIGSDYGNQMPTLLPGDTVEKRIEIDNDSRISLIEVWANRGR